MQARWPLHSVTYFCFLSCTPPQQQSELYKGHVIYRVIPCHETLCWLLTTLRIQFKPRWPLPIAFREQPRISIPQTGVHLQALASAHSFPCSLRTCLLAVFQGAFRSWKARWRALSMFLEQHPDAQQSTCYPDHVAVLPTCSGCPSYANKTLKVLINVTHWLSISTCSPAGTGKC